MSEPVSFSWGACARGATDLVCYAVRMSAVLTLRKGTSLRTISLLAKKRVDKEGGYDKMFMETTMKPDDLRKWRKERNLSQERLAQLLRVSGQSVRNWEAGRHEIPKTQLGLKERLDKIAEQKKKLNK